MSSKLRPLAPQSFPLVNTDRTPAQQEYAFELDRLVRTLEATSGTGGVPVTRLLTAGTGLTGGGDLSADRTFAVTYGTTAGTAAQGNDSRIIGAAQTTDLGSAAFEDTTAFDAAGTAVAAVAAHVAASDPHPQYLTATEGSASYAPLSHVGSGGSAHANAVASGAAGFMTGTDKASLDGAIKGLLYGLTLSTAGSSSTFGVAAGSATDSTAAQVMALASAYTKTTSSWAVGTANGALDTGTVANSTWYHVHLIKRTDTGVVDVLLSLSPTAPTLPTNYTLFRRIGSMLTNGSAQWVKFIQDGDRFVWDVPATDATVINPGTTAVLRALTVPAGINTFAAFHARCYLTTAGGAVATIFTDPAQTDTAPDFTNSQQIGNTSLSPFSNIKIRTNTSRQIRIRSNFSDATTNLIVVTDGWIDVRGRT